MNNAQREVDPEKKTRLYRMTEAILRASSEHFAKAKQLEKTKQVSNLLKTVREEQEWALSCAQILRTPPLVSSSHFAPPPSPTFERAIGLNGFEHATVQAYLSASKEAVVGGELEVRLDLINVSKNSGLLVRVENAIPKSLKIVSSEPSANIENGSLDLKGKRLEPLKVDSIKINAQAIVPGTITLNPKVIYVDDAGRFKACKPKQVHVTIKPRSSFEFRAKSAEAILSFLASSYLEDSERKLPTDRCGWRSLVDVMKTGKVPRSSVYRVGGGRGSAITELEKRGLIEAKVVSGERGRGGNILKLRIRYETEDAKTYLRQHKFIGENW
jgi:hypothetical protein